MNTIRKGGTGMNMKMLLYVVAVLAFAGIVILLAEPAQADEGVLIREYVQGLVKYCVYDVYGQEVIVTVDVSDLCPFSIDE